MSNLSFHKKIEKLAILAEATNTGLDLTNKDLHRMKNEADELSKKINLMKNDRNTGSVKEVVTKQSATHSNCSAKFNT